MRSGRIQTRVKLSYLLVDHRFWVSEVPKYCCYRNRLSCKHRQFGSLGFSYFTKTKAITERKTDELFFCSSTKMIRRTKHESLTDCLWPKVLIFCCIAIFEWLIPSRRKSMAWLSTISDHQCFMFNSKWTGETDIGKPSKNKKINKYINFFLLFFSCLRSKIYKLDNKFVKFNLRRTPIANNTIYISTLTFCTRY